MGRSPLRKVRKTVELFKKTGKKGMLPPGTPVHIGDVPDFKPYVTVRTYCPETLTETEKLDNGRVEPVLRNLSLENKINWIDVEGIHDLSLIKQISQIFDIHPLTQEDLVNTNLRPAFESYQGYQYFTLKMLYMHPETKVLTQEHVSFILKANTVISFQEKPGDVFQVIRDRLSKGIGRVRSRGADYLVYMLLDAIVDGYYQVVDAISDKIETLEEELRFEARGDHVERIHELRREMLFLRKNILPVRDMISKIQVEGSVFAENSKIYITDLSDHIQQVADSISIYTELSGVLLETYHSQSNMKMNQVMKVLTMFSTIFLPLNFIAGIYGMNFEYMPELQKPWAYPLVLSMMFFVAVLMFGWFVWAGWLFERRRKPISMSRQNSSLAHTKSGPQTPVSSSGNGSGSSSGSGVGGTASGTGSGVQRTP